MARKNAERLSLRLALRLAHRWGRRFVGDVAPLVDARESRVVGHGGRFREGDAWTDARSAERSAHDLADRDPESGGPLYVDAARRYRAAASPIRGGEPYWRAARCEWLAGEMLPPEDKQGRMAHFGAAESLAQMGIDSDPRCAECMLWKFSSIGRLRTTSGVMSGALQVSEMAELLDTAIALQPTHRDDDDNSTLGNLHYGSAVFYRVVPDWFWLEWVLGVRGDKERALDHARKALALHPGRIDFRVELGSQLLCMGTSERERDMIAEGKRAMRDALQLEPEDERGRRELAAARIMLEQPAKACGYTGDTWVEIDEGAAKDLKSSRL